MNVCKILLVILKKNYKITIPFGWSTINFFDGAILNMNKIEVKLCCCDVSCKNNCEFLSFVKLSEETVFARQRTFSFSSALLLLSSSLLVGSSQPQLPSNSLPVNCPELPMYNTIQAQASLLCAIDRECLQRICSHLSTWKEINNLGLTCKLLDLTVTVPDKPLTVNCGLKCREVGLRGVLSLAYQILARVGVRQGNNPLRLDLSWNSLSKNESLLERFFASAVFSRVAHNVVCVNLSYNVLSKIPWPCFCLPALLELQVRENSLNQQDLELLENLKKLQVLDMGANNLGTLPRTLCCLTALRKLGVDSNDLTQQNLNVVEKLINLEELDLSNNAFSLEDVVQRVKSWPNLKRLKAHSLSEGENISQVWLNLPKTLDMRF